MNVSSPKAAKKHLRAGWRASLTKSKARLSRKSSPIQAATTHKIIFAEISPPLNRLSDYIHNTPVSAILQALNARNNKYCNFA
jgi:hypothetical protein